MQVVVVTAHSRREELDLALSVALLSSYLQQPVPANTLFAGELDLATRIRPPQHGYLRNLATVLLGSQACNIRRVFVGKEAAARLSKLQAEKDGPPLGDNIQVIGVTDLQDVLAELWPDLTAHSEPNDGKGEHGKHSQKQSENEFV